MLVHLSVNFRRTLFQDEDEKIVGERITPALKKEVSRIGSFYP
jgi:hypothetical protein